MKGFLALAACLCLLTGCANTPHAQFNSDIRIIDADDLEQYWTRAEERIRFQVQAAPDEFVCGQVVTRYVIDSNGEVFNAEIISSEPPGMYDKTALTALRNL